MQKQKEQRIKWKCETKYDLNNKEFQYHLLYNYVCLCRAELYLRDLERSYDFYHLANVMTTQNGEPIDVNLLVEEEILFLMIRDTQTKIYKMKAYLREYDKVRFNNIYDDIFKDELVYCSECNTDLPGIPYVTPDFLLVLGGEYANIVCTGSSIEEVVHQFNMQYYQDAEHFDKREELLKDLYERWEVTGESSYFITKMMEKILHIDE